ncbi:hypothetical protein PISMIDRAFT_89024 [Pisolithus microcarpus 441]|uniref:DUF4219 domain-containing protein n=1 Tax=Pisolithus microcarpus 441 TaxID=765257 RepID=A0A0C9ZK21_9AGAM|nr:hypothetical protein PISMIDRAFT_89024 [Pisolithus microcarpus 441]
MSSDQTPHIKPLNGTNYSTWSEEMKALLHSKGLWRLVSGTEAHPTAAGDDQDKWDAKADKAAGEIMLALEADQRVHIRTVQDDPVAAWNALATLYVQQCPGA